MRLDPSVRSVRVLEVVRPPDGTTRYIDQVVTFADDAVEFSYASLASLLVINYDVVHLHWPEMVVRHRLRVIEAVKCRVFDAWIRRLRRRNVAIVRTLHNVQPHDGARRPVAQTLKRLDAVTDLFVVINSATPVPEGGMYIPHGHYRDRFQAHLKSIPQSGRVLHAGLIRPYKGVEGLLEAFGRMRDKSVTLRVVGKPLDAHLRTTVTQAAAQTPDRISARLEFVADDEFVREMTSAELVCLPYQELHNSGILLVALSLDRPALVPDSASARALADEVGQGWVMTFSGQIEASDIERALAAVRTSARSARPTLGDRNWQRVGRLYSEAFTTARDRARAR